MNERRVERVARAMCWSLGQNPDGAEQGKLNHDVIIAYDRSKPYWHGFESLARAAVDALSSCLTPEYDSKKREDLYVELD